MNVFDDPDDLIDGILTAETEQVLWELISLADSSRRMSTHLSKILLADF